MSLVDRVRQEIRGIIAEEMARLVEYKEHADEVIERTSKRLDGLVESYKDLEHELDGVKLTGIMSLTSDTAKVSPFDLQRPRGYMRSDGVYEVTVNVDSSNPFDDHPSSRYFKLSEAKKYKILVAFIELKEEKS